MGNTLPAATSAVSDIAGYGPLFEQAFGDRKVTIDRIAKATGTPVRAVVSLVEELAKNGS